MDKKRTYGRGQLQPAQQKEEDKSDVTRCPYNNSHVVTKSRLLWHIQKCKSSNAVKNNYGHCKYNYLHIIPLDQLAAHEDMYCSDRPKAINKKDDYGDQAIHDEAFKNWKNKQNKEARNRNKKNNEIQQEENNGEVEEDYEKFNRIQMENQMNSDIQYQINNSMQDQSLLQNINDKSRINKSWLEGNDKQNLNPQGNNTVNLKCLEKSQFQDSDSSDSISSSDAEEESQQEPDVSFDKIQQSLPKSKNQKRKGSKNSSNSSYIEDQQEESEDEADYEKRKNRYPIKQHQILNQEDEDIDNHELSYMQKPQGQKNTNIKQKQQQQDSQSDSSDSQDSSSSSGEEDDDSEERKHSSSENDNDNIYKKKQNNFIPKNQVEDSLDASIQYINTNIKEKKLIKSNRNEIESNKVAQSKNDTRKFKKQDPIDSQSSSSDQRDSDSDQKQKPKKNNYAKRKGSSSESNSSDEDDKRNNKNSKNKNQNNTNLNKLKSKRCPSNSSDEEDSGSEDLNSKQKNESSIQDKQNISVMNADEFTQSFMDNQKKSKYQKRYVQVHNLPEDQRNIVDQLQADLDQSQDCSKKAIEQLSRGTRGNRSEQQEESFEKRNTLKSNLNNSYAWNNNRSNNEQDRRQNQRTYNNPNRRNNDNDESYVNNNNNRNGRQNRK